jgi:hypothetical protein
MLGLSICGAGVAGKLRVKVRDGWCEPLNLFAVVALPPGERKSAVFAEALAPVQDHEADERERMAPAIAEALSVLRQMEARRKQLEGKIAKAAKGVDLASLREQVKELTREITAHVVPVDPCLWCDDIPPEKLANVLALHGGRMLQASAEGTLFEIVKGRYSEGGKANLEVYLKAHAGDALRVQRISRDEDSCERPVLSIAVTVQPDVIHGLAEKAVMKLRGFLARWCYALPASKVGRRTVAPTPVPDNVRTGYRECVLALWRLEPAEGAVLAFSAEADTVLQDLERWLEPQLGRGEALYDLAGWAGKLAGLCARIAGILHLAAGGRADEQIGSKTVEDAAKLGREYLLSHALAAFALMGADERTALARRLWRAAVKLVRQRYGEGCEGCEGGVPTLSRRDLHQAVRGKATLTRAEDIDPILALLVDRYYLRPVDAGGAPGKGHSSPVYEVSPKALALPLSDNDTDSTDPQPPVPHISHIPHSDRDGEDEP